MELFVKCGTCGGNGNCDYAATGHIHSAEDEGDCPACEGAGYVPLTPENCPGHEMVVTPWQYDEFCRYCGEGVTP